jgi:uncharacterized protein (TIGR02145 family)
MGMGNSQRYFSEPIKLKGECAMRQLMISGVVAFVVISMMVTASFAAEEPVNYEGNTYHVITIGNQRWLKENIDVGTMIQGSKNANNDGKIEKYCYDNNPDNCAKFGGLYQWDEAMGYSKKEKARGICPRGWHLPTYDELWALRTAVGKNGNSLKMEGQGTGSGAGTNVKGFSALLSGIRLFDGRFHKIGDASAFWSSSEESGNEAVYMNLAGTMSAIDVNKISRTSGFSVRCIKD